MKRKGITIWEQHLERFVLGAAVLFFAVFAALQFLSEPNAVEHQRETIKPGEVDARLESRAEGLRGRLEEDAPPAFEIAAQEPILDRFVAMLSDSISPAATLPVTQAEVMLVGGAPPVGDVTYVVPVPPAPNPIVVHQFFDAIADDEIAAYPELAEIPSLAAAPFDLSWNTAAAVFNVKAVFDQFRTEGPNGENAIPDYWYFSEVNILDVRVEREEYINGTWSDLKLLAPMPGRISLREELEGELDRSARDELIERLDDTGVRREILQPEFYATKNDVFAPPDPNEKPADPNEELDDAQRAARDLAQKIRRDTSERDRYIQQLLEAGGQLEPPEEPTPPAGGAAPPGRPSAPGGGGAGGGGGRAPPGSRAPPGGRGGSPGFGTGEGGAESGRRSSTDKALIETLKNKIKKKDKLIDRNMRKLVALVGEEAANQLVGGEMTKSAGVISLDGDEVIVWAHDLTTEAGHTYRYRFTVDVYNPFFGHKVELLEAQHTLAESIKISSNTSAWSAPIEAIPPIKAWVTRAYLSSRNQGQLGLGQAKVEVYRFYDGRWWRTETTLEPGDRVGEMKLQRQNLGGDGQPQSVDYGTDWFVLDIIPNIDAERGELDKGLGASVLLQSLSDPSLTKLHDPNVNETDAARLELRRLADDADSREELASSGG